MVVPIRLDRMTRRSGVVCAAARASDTIPPPCGLAGAIRRGMFGRSGAAGPDAAQLDLGLGAAVGDGDPRRPARRLAGGSRLACTADADAEVAVLEEAAGRADRRRMDQVAELAGVADQGVAACRGEQDAAVAGEGAAGAEQALALD